MGFTMSPRKKSLSPVLAFPASIGLLSGAIAIAATCSLSPAPALAGSRVAIANHLRFAQEKDSEGDDTDVPPQDVDKYIKVYKAMQQNRNLTVEQAAAQQGLTVPQFRSLENRIQRNDALREHVRDALKPKATASPAQ